MGWLLVFLMATVAALGWKAIEHRRAGTALSWVVASAIVASVVVALFIALRLGIQTLP